MAASPLRARSTESVAAPVASAPSNTSPAAETRTRWAGGCAADDSYGVIGELGHAAWAAYVGTPWRDLVPPDVYWRDVAELVAFDDYAHLHRAETLPWRQARKADLPLITHSLRALAEEYGAARLPYHADQARIALAYAHVATAALTGYATVARDLGSEHWMPVVALAESALGARRPDVAAAVFDAADQPGAHRDYLRRRRAALLDG